MLSTLYLHRPDSISFLCSYQELPLTCSLLKGSTQKVRRLPQSRAEPSLPSLWAGVDAA